jgi:hypothetical protein
MKNGQKCAKLAKIAGPDQECCRIISLMCAMTGSKTEFAAFGLIRLSGSGWQSAAQFGFRWEG